MMDNKLTEFNYLLNRLTHAGRQERPADHHYGTHLASLVRHVRALEKGAERYSKLRSGQHMSVIDGIGDVLRGEELDRAVDALPGKDTP